MKIAFIIAHKYFKGYKSYLRYYVDNIRKFYRDSLIIIVDNNSIDKNDAFQEISKFDNVVILDNDIECKFEIGAYQVGIQHMVDKNLLDTYDYVVFSQDTFILKNKYDFNILKENNITACSIVSWHNDWAYMEHSFPVLSKLKMLNNLENTRLCWCNSFIVSKTKILQLYEYLRTIIITIRKQSEASERYLGRILWELNNGKNSDIDGDIDELSYYCHTVDPLKEIDNFFCKKSQQKNENTPIT